MKYTNEEWINFFVETHGDKYDYFETNCNNKDDKGRVKVICHKHGEFWIRPSHHKNGHGCKKCGCELSEKEKLKKQIELENKVNELYGDYYDISNSKYNGYYNKLEIKCPMHGIQYRTPSQIYNGSICQECNKERLRENSLSNTDEYIKKAIKVHNGKYTYNNCVYIDSRHSITATCFIHGDFSINANSHLNGRGCQKCSNQRFRFMTNEEREILFRDVHGDNYIYDWSTYTNNHSKMNIICKKHGEFKQTPTKHLVGNGCPKCNRSHLEEEIKQLLLDNNIQFIEQYKCDWLGLQSIDFYLPNYNIAIECQGGQHFLPIKFYGGNKEFDRRKILDENKRKRCEEHDIKILYYSNMTIDYPYKVFTNKNELLKEIIKGENN